jgi:hypothetical protein
VDPVALARARAAAPPLARRAAWRVSDVSYSAIGDGGLRVRLRWARWPAGAIAAFIAPSLAPPSRPLSNSAMELAPAFWIASGRRFSRIAAWLAGRGIRPVSARLIQLAPSAWELPE